jgi:hypothetical protein
VQIYEITSPEGLPLAGPLNERARTAIDDPGWMAPGHLCQWGRLASVGNGRLARLHAKRPADGRTHGPALTGLP